jgi:hypothetical protein
LSREIFGDGGEPWNGGLSWHLLCHLGEEFKAGVEWHSAFGDLDNMDSFKNQEHVFGPTLHGELFEELDFEFSALFAVSKEPADLILRWQLEYEF